MAIAHPLVLMPAATTTNLTALTTALTTITIADAAGTPDYAISAVTTSSPSWTATAAESISLLYVIKNLQTRVNEIEARLVSLGVLA